MSIAAQPRYDDGYSAICGGCGAGHTPNRFLIGKERWLEWANCPACTRLAKLKQERLERDGVPRFKQVAKA